jgi:hypothetical protein
MRDAAGINVALPEYGFFFFSEILTHDGDHPYRGKEAGGEREIRCGAAEDFVGFAVRSFDGVKSYGTHYQQ